VQKQVKRYQGIVDDMQRHERDELLDEIDRLRRRVEAEAMPWSRARAGASYFSCGIQSVSSSAAIGVLAADAWEVSLGLLEDQCRHGLDICVVM